VDADTLTVIADDIALVGLTVTNPAPAHGGSDDEPLESVRQKVLWRGISTPDRAISLADYERVALNVAGVGKARAYAPSGSSVLVFVGPLDDGTERPGTFTRTGVKQAFKWDTFTPDDPNLDWSSDSNLHTSMTSTTFGPYVADPQESWNTKYATIGGHNVTWDGIAWREVLNQPPHVPFSDMSPNFVEQVMPAVRKVLSDASSAGTQVVVNPIRYVPVYLSVKITADDPQPSRLVQAGARRLRTLFSYRNTSIEQELTRYGVQISMSSASFTDVSLERFTTKVDQLTLVEEKITLGVDEVPFLPVSLTDAELVQVTDSNSSSSRHLQSRSFSPQRGIVGTTIHTATRRSL
jgi:Baseplate J-like protein